MHNSAMEDAHLRTALEAAGIGTWQFEILSGKMQFDAIAKDLFGVISDEAGVNYKQVFSGRKESGADIYYDIEAAIASGGLIEFKYWVAQQQGSPRCLLIKGRRVQATDSTMGVAGTVQDVTGETIESGHCVENEYRFRSIIEQAPVATALYVGTDLIIEVANDVMLSYWGRTRSVIGTCLSDALPELEGQPFIQILKNIFDTGETYQVTDAPVTLASHGVLGTYYFDFTYKPLYNSAGTIYAIMNTAIEVTEKVRSKQELLLSEKRYRSIIQQAPVATCLFVGRDLKVEVANDLMLSYWGRDRSIIGMPIVEGVPELKGQPFLDILDRVYTSGEIYTVSEAPAQLPVDGVMGTYYFDFTYKPLFNSDNEVYAIMDMAIDVTERVMSRKKVQRSEARFRAITEQSPMAIGFLKGRDMIIEIGNDKIFQVWGKSPSITGHTIEEALPEIKGQGFIELLRNVFDTGKAFHGYDVPARLEHNGQLKEVYFDFTYSPLRDEDGNVEGVLVLANDVSERAETVRKIAASEAKFRALMEASPASMVIFKGEDLVIDMPNQAFLEFIDRDQSVSGKPLLEAIPEIEGQESLRLLQECYHEGKNHHSFGRPVKLVKDGQLATRYYNVSYTPLYDAEGKIYAVLDTAIDVTEAIKARQAIEEAEASLRGAIELAELATWSIDPKTTRLTFSDRMLQWHGVENTDDPADVFDTVHERDRERISESIARALNPAGDGVYEEEYTITNRINGRERIIHAQGKAQFGEDGVAHILQGTAQDITGHRRLQMALENEVRERTLDLQAANRGLEDANLMLTASNEELAQYAYVASHDLQEPLRKITMYSNLLSERDTENKFSSLTSKIINSSRRMSLLIKDLLEFSRLLHTDARFVETNLNTIVNAVRDDFELLISEKNAAIAIDTLPVITAVPLQMNQLFYNLIGNALKFVAKGKSPMVKITCAVADDDLILNYIHHPLPKTKYFLIQISDNGIGIEAQYVKQIFEVFKRLHGRDEYSGSGIGLAICRRIVINHNGAIYTNSVVGEGTTFSIILPEKPL